MENFEYIYIYFFQSAVWMTSSVGIDSLPYHFPIQLSTSIHGIIPSETIRCRHLKSGFVGQLQPLQV